MPTNAWGAEQFLDAPHAAGDRQRASAHRNQGGCHSCGRGTGEHGTHAVTTFAGLAIGTGFSFGLETGADSVSCSSVRPAPDGR
jgi:hypothetical protein